MIILFEILLGDYMFVKFFKTGKTLFLRKDIYQLYEVDNCAIRSSTVELILNSFASQVYSFMKERKFDIYIEPYVGNKYSVVTLIIHNKSEEAQLNLYNHGVIEVNFAESAPTNQPIFKI